MNVATRPAQMMDMVQFIINTGSNYNGPQIVIASLVNSTSIDNNNVNLVFQIVDDSRCIYEKVGFNANWDLIKSCQNDSKKDWAINKMAQRIMDEYRYSRYVY